MKTEAESFDSYLANVSEEKKEAFLKLAAVIRDHLPQGFSESIQYGIPCWNISLEDYPAGYHCAKDTPLPFLSIASQKNFIALYHMGIYAQQELLKWFQDEFPTHSKKKLDMGKSCIRFRKPEDIPYNLIAELCRKMTPNDWIQIYEEKFKR